MKSRRIIPLATALLTALTPFASAEAPAPAKAALTTPAGGTTTLWSVKGATNTVYLLGTVHILRPEDYPLPAAMDAAFADSKSLVMEVNSADMNAPETMTYAMQRGTYQDGSTLQQHLKPETYALFAQRATASGMPPAMFASMKPWMATMSLVMMELTKSGYDLTKGVDKHFEARSLEAGRKVEAFETAKMQLGMLDKLSETFGDEMIRQTIEEADTLSKMLDDIVVAWKAGDSSKIEALMLKSFKGYPEVEKALLTDRNVAWTQKLDADYLKRPDNVLVVVGAAHLVGANSVVAMLKKKGYTVTQL